MTESIFNMLAQTSASEVFQDPDEARLAEAVAIGDRQRISALVQQGVDVDACGEIGISLLHWAFFQQSIDGMLALLAAGADPASGDIYGNTVLHYAAMAEDPKLLEALLAAGVSPDLSNREVRETPLFVAIEHGREPQCRALLAAGADLEAQDVMWNRPLHIAAGAGDLAQVLALLEAGADPCARNRDGEGFMELIDDDVDTPEFREARGKVEAWLEAHGVELEPATGG